MKIALLNTCSPFIRGGAEVLVDDFERELKKRGYFVDVYKLPDNHFLQSFMLFVNSLRFDEYDYVIAFKCPVYAIKHPNKIIWMLHQFRQVYELYGTEFGIRIDEWTRAIKRSVEYVDKTSIDNAKYVATICAVVSERLLKYNNIKVDVIHPPLENADKYYFESTGDYVYFPSRINIVKRQHILVEAMKYTKSNAKALISGVFENEDYKANIASIIQKNNLQNKVTVIDRWITDEEKRKYMANSLGCVFIPYAEDYGYITLEAFYSHKPLITFSDSGGPSTFVKDGINGYIVEPNPKELAKAIDKLHFDKGKAVAMGKSAYKYICECNITWDETIRRLLK